METMKNPTYNQKWNRLSDQSSNSWRSKERRDIQKVHYQWKSLQYWKIYHHNNFKKTSNVSKKDTRKYQSEEWMVPEKINKSLLPYLKKHNTETTQIVSTIQKITENTRFQARVAMEIFDELQFLLQENPEPLQARKAIEGIIEQSKRLAVFELATAKQQEREAKAFADKALNIPLSLKHLETNLEDGKTNN